MEPKDSVMVIPSCVLPFLKRRVQPLPTILGHCRAFLFNRARIALDKPLLHFSLNSAGCLLAAYLLAPSFAVVVYEYPPLA